MLTCNITNWVETQKKLKSCHVLRIATQNQERWTRKAARWNPGLVISTKTQRRSGRPAKRWEDDLNEFVEDGETEATQSDDLKNNNTWLVAATNVCELEKRDNALNMLSMTEEHNITQQHDDEIPSHSSTTDENCVRAD